MSYNEEEYCKAIDKINTRVREFLGDDECVVVFSAYDTTLDIPLDNLDHIPINGLVMIVEDEESREMRVGIHDSGFFSEVLESPTWLQICKVANDMILATNDVSHCYLEKARCVREENGVKVVELCMGS